MAEPITGIILAGGASRRFGEDKATYVVDGRPLIVRVYDAIKDVVDSVYVSGAAVPLLALPTIFDRYPGSGPLAGLHAALCEATTPWVFIAACDMPNLTPEVASMLVAGREADCRAVVGVTSDGRRQPLVACYHRSLQSLAEEMLRSGHLSMREFVSRIDSVNLLDVPDEALTNLNRRPLFDRCHASNHSGL